MEGQLPASNGMEEKDWPNNDPCLSRDSSLFDPKLQNASYGHAKGWAGRIMSFLCILIPIVNPQAKVVQRWNQFFVFACLVAIFIDPLFFFLLTVQKDNKCIVLDLRLTKILVIFRTVTDFIYFLHMVLQSRLAYVNPESRMVGAGDFVECPKKIALHYLCSYFFVDLFIVLPLPQIIVLVILPDYVGSSAANYAKSLLRATLLLQYIPKLFRFLPLLAGQSPTGFIFESAWANFFINLLTFILAGHVVGSSWYLLGLQRVNKCLEEACNNSQLKFCSNFMDCGHGEKIAKFTSNPEWLSWVNNENATACFVNVNGNFNYGIYIQAVPITTIPSLITRYVYSFVWGFQQISTLAGNQVPSDFVWEVLFTMFIIGLGLLLFALLIGNMQNFLQALGKRRLNFQLRRREVEQWMSHWHLPKEVRRKVRASERFNWSITQGVDEEILMKDLPEDLQREIRQEIRSHLREFIKNVRIFTEIEDPILDAICERIRQSIYIRGSNILNVGKPVEKMVFIVRGKMESFEEDSKMVSLSEGEVCGEELLAWCIEHSSMNKDGQGQPLLSRRTVRCLTDVEAFTLRAADLEEVTARPTVQRAISGAMDMWKRRHTLEICVSDPTKEQRERSRGTRLLHSSSHPINGPSGASHPRFVPSISTTMPVVQPLADVRPSTSAPRLATKDTPLPAFPGWYYFDGYTEQILEVSEIVPGMPIDYDYVDRSKYYELLRMVYAFRKLTKEKTIEATTLRGEVEALKRSHEDLKQKNVGSDLEITGLRNEVAQLRMELTQLKGFMETDRPLTFMAHGLNGGQALEGESGDGDRREEGGEGTIGAVGRGGADEENSRET